jgi:hypothetical protein
MANGPRLNPSPISCRSTTHRTGSRHRSDAEYAPVAPHSQIPAQMTPCAGYQRGFLTRSPLVLPFAKTVLRSIPMRPIPIVALVVGLLQSAAAFCVMLSPHAGFAPAFSPIAPASGAGFGVLSMGAASERGLILCGAGTHSDNGARS